MDEVSNSDRGGVRRGGLLLRLAAVAVLGTAGGAVLYACKAPEHKAEAPVVGKSDLARFATGALKKLETPAATEPAPTTPFNDRDGKPTSLAAFKGKVAVVNLWATWCAPCVTEMPTLAALQKAYAGTDLVVVPVSLDRPKDVPDAKNFIGVHDPLVLYSDPTFTLPSAMKVKGLPSTIIYDRQGREVARLSGEAKWDSPEAKALFDELLKRK